MTDYASMTDAELSAVVARRMDLSCPTHGGFGCRHHDYPPDFPNDWQAFGQLVEHCEEKFSERRWGEICCEALMMYKGGVDLRQALCIAFCQATEPDHD